MFWHSTEETADLLFCLPLPSQQLTGQSDKTDENDSRSKRELHGRVGGREECVCAGSYDFRLLVGGKPLYVKAYFNSNN